MVGEQKSIRSIRRWLVQGFIVYARVQGQNIRIYSVRSHRGIFLGTMKNGHEFSFARVVKGKWDNA